VADVEEVAGDLLTDLGYELTGARVPLWLRGLRALYHDTLSFARSVVDALKRQGII
jgi:hypothetical protein